VPATVNNAAKILGGIPDTVATRAAKTSPKFAKTLALPGRKKMRPR
jgi:hypothetical protein